MCGEKFAPIYFTPFYRGSPPHVRGKVFFLELPNKTSRITPACAGKSADMGRCDAGVEDHPRMCGEKTGIRSLATSVIGSPPHVRGKVYRLCQSACGRKDHPRMCGEK